MTNETATMDFQTYLEIAKFINNEADLLDLRKFRKWLHLFTEDGIYWVPAERGQKDPFSHVSLFYDDYATLKIRVSRLEHPRIHCQSPESGAVRVLGQPIIDAIEGDTIRARSKFVMVEDRLGAPKRVFSGTYEYVLTRLEGALKIKSKSVLLTDCDQSFPALAVPF